MQSQRSDICSTPTYHTVGRSFIYMTNVAQNHLLHVNRLNRYEGLFCAFSGIKLVNNFWFCHLLMFLYHYQSTAIKRNPHRLSMLNSWYMLTAPYNNSKHNFGLTNGLFAWQIRITQNHKKPPKLNLDKMLFSGNYRWWRHNLTLYIRID